MDNFSEVSVSSLINPTFKCWNFGLLSLLFSPQEAELVKNIPFCRNSAEDKMVWPFVSSGVYSVKSGYVSFLKKEPWELRCQQIQISFKVYGNKFWMQCFG